MTTVHPDGDADPDSPEPEVLTGHQKAVAGAILSTLALIAAFAAEFAPAPWSTFLLGLAGLLGIVGVPWGVYSTRNRITVR